MELQFLMFLKIENIEVQILKQLINGMVIINEDGWRFL
jgi:hypothetical protein